MISRCLAITASFANQRKNVLFAGIDLSAQIERSDSPQEMRAQITSWIARVRIEGRPGRRLVTFIALVSIAAARSRDKSIAQPLARACAKAAATSKCQKPRSAVRAFTDIHRYLWRPKRCFPSACALATFL